MQKYAAPETRFSCIPLTLHTEELIQGDMRLVHEATGCTGIMYPQSQMTLSFDTSSPSESHGDDYKRADTDDLSKFDLL